MTVSTSTPRELLTDGQRVKFVASLFSVSCVLRWGYVTDFQVQERNKKYLKWLGVFAVAGLTFALHLDH